MQHHEEIRMHRKETTQHREETRMHRKETTQHREETRMHHNNIHIRSQYEHEYSNETHTTHRIIKNIDSLRRKEETVSCTKEMDDNDNEDSESSTVIHAQASEALETVSQISRATA